MSSGLLSLRPWKESNRVIAFSERITCWKISSDLQTSRNGQESGNLSISLLLTAVAYLISKHKVTDQA